MPATPTRRSVWADPLSLAATDGVSIDFLSYRYWDVSVPCVRFYGLWIQPEMIPISWERVSPFGHFRINGCSTPALNLSQSATSFIASRHLDIPHTPLVTWPYQSKTDCRFFHNGARWKLCILIHNPPWDIYAIYFRKNFTDSLPNRSPELSYILIFYALLRP